VQALVATDVAARGIHVDAVGCVLHFDPPEDEKAYVHRSGRTGRAGAGGTVLSLVTHDTAGAVKALQRALGFPTRTTAPDLTGPVVVLRPKSAERKPEQAKTERTKPDGTKKQGPKRDWAAATGVPVPRRKPDGRPARGFGRRKAQSRRARPA
jgi:superfamily II DNA/RNA helicase